MESEFQRTADSSPDLGLCVLAQVRQSRWITLRFKIFFVQFQYRGTSVQCKHNKNVSCCLFTLHHGKRKQSTITKGSDATVGPALGLEPGRLQVSRCNLLYRSVPLVATSSGHEVAADPQDAASQPCLSQSEKEI